MIGLDQRYREGTCEWKVMATRYVLRTGEVILSNRNPEELDVYCYRTGANDHTCLLLSDQSVRFGLIGKQQTCLLYTSPSPRDTALSRMPSSA